MKNVNLGIIVLGKISTKFADGFKNSENANASNARNNQVANGDDETNDVHHDFRNWDIQLDVCDGRRIPSWVCESAVEPKVVI